MWLPRTPTPPLAVEHNGIISTTFFDACRPSIVRWVKLARVSPYNALGNAAAAAASQLSQHSSELQR